MSIEQIFMIFMMVSFVILFLDRHYELNTNYPLFEKEKK